MSVSSEHDAQGIERTPLELIHSRSQGVNFIRANKPLPQSRQEMHRNKNYSWLQPMKHEIDPAEHIIRPAYLLESSAHDVANHC
jgi:hypothetical protein